uniref:Uncharacterized protein n=1 Tax=Avena sativa TaxID=4498 RepID=A0ACD5VKN6_AVESA
MARTGATAVLFALVCCLLVGPAPARRPELLPQVVLGAVDREASAVPLLPVIVEVANPNTVLSSVHRQEVDPAGQAPQIIRCGVEDMAVSEEPLSLGTSAQPAAKSEVEDVQEQERREDDSDSDSDSDDEDNKDGILGWFWRLARRF